MARPNLRHREIPNLKTTRTTKIVLATLMCLMGMMGTMGTMGMMGAVSGAAQDVESVAARASRYVLEYEEQLGSIIAEEQYTQGARWVRPPRGRRSSSQVDEEERELRSDYLILRAGGLWLGFRNVIEVDGVKVTDTREGFEQFFRETNELTTTQLKALIDASAEYNIGDVQRNINLPTFALMVLRPGNTFRFEFTKVGEETVEGVPTWILGFEETARPPFLGGSPGNETRLSGSLWVDPVTGRVIRTETRISTEKKTLEAAIVVRYVPDSRLGLWVPVQMEERYTGSNGHEVDGSATYSNFRRFEVEVRLIPD